MSKRITFFDGTLEKGGAERVISILSKKLAEASYDVEILLYFDRKIYYQIDKRVKITTIQGKTGTTNIIRNMLWMRSYLKGKETCLVSFLAPFNMLALVVSFGLKLPVIVADRNDPRHVPERFIIRKIRDFLYQFANRVIVQTSHNKEYFNKRLMRKIEIIYNPVDVGKTKGIGLVTKKKKKIVSVGRLMEQKNQQLLIKCFSKIKNRYPEYKLNIYGEGPERGKLEKQIHELGLDRDVILEGQVDDVFSEIANSEIFVLSSNYEGMPNALIEAMCLGLPVISTKVSGATDLIEEGINGLLVDCMDEIQLCDALQHMISDNEFRKNCAENAVDVANKLDADVILSKWIAVIEEVKNEI